MTDSIAQSTAVRLASKTDVTAVQNLMSQAFEHEVSHGFDDTLDPNWPLSENGRCDIENLVHRDEDLLLVGTVGSACVGYLVGCAIRQDTIGTYGTIAQLRGVFVEELARCKGMGRRLCQEFLAWSRTKGCICVTVAVACDNEKATSLYRNLGFCDRTLILELRHNLDKKIQLKPNAGLSARDGVD